MCYRDLQARLSQISGHFSRSREETWGIRALAVVIFLVSCYLVGLMYRYIDANFDPFLKVFLVLLVAGLFTLAIALFRHGNGSYSVSNGVIYFERPRGNVQWRGQIADISGVSGSPDWFWEKWIVVKFGDRKRRVELLPSLLEALAATAPPNNSFERTREG